MTDRTNTTEAPTIATVIASAFRDGYEQGKLDSIDRCFIERVAAGPDPRTHNTAVNLCVAAIRALDVRHAWMKWKSE